MGRKVIGYIFNEPYLKKDELIFKKVAKRKNLDILMINASKDLNEKDLEIAVKKCDIFFNNSAEEFSLEVARMIKSLGGKVIDNPEEAYTEEDKWLFFLMCKKHRISTPRTILLSENINIAKKELSEMGCWPVILKRVRGTCGDYVSKAENVGEVEKIMLKFWRDGKEKIPIIAQEMIRSPCYRVTMIGGKVVQTAVKKSKGWKSTGVYEKRFKKFKIDKELREILEKFHKVFKIKVCGIDFLKKGDKWFALEVNSQPGLDFFEGEREKIIGQVLDFLKKEIYRSS